MPRGQRQAQGQRQGSPKLLITGGTGLLGATVVKEAVGRAWDVVATRHASAAPALTGVRWFELDLATPGAAAQVIERARPSVIVHTAVAIAPEQLDPVIVRGSEEVARAARNAGAALVHVSSDMVFDGESGPFDEDAPLSPITDYGRAKAEAEVRVRAAHDGASVARLSLLYRLDPPDRSLAAWLEGARGAADGAGGAGGAGGAYPLFTDEVRCPGEVGDVARALLDLAFRLAAGPPGLPEVRTVHLVGPTAITRYDFGRLVLEALGLPDSLARPALSASSGLVRPRALHLLRRTTPPSLVAGIRGPEEALAVRP